MQQLRLSTSGVPARGRTSCCPTTAAARLHRPAAAAVRPSHCSVRAQAAATSAPEQQTSEQQAPEPAQAGQQRGYKDALVFQSFGWDSCDQGGTFYKSLQSKLADLKELSVTHVWLPPPSQSVSKQGYLPGQLYNLESAYGSKDDLVALLRAVKDAGMVPMADIVINHRCADEMVDGKYNKFRDDVSHDGKKIDWGKWAITGNDPVFGGTGNPDTGDDYDAAPDLDHLNPELRAALTDWLSWLQHDIGFGAWRLDFVRGYGAQFVQEYIAATVTADALCIGEYWVDMAWDGSELHPDQDAARKRLCDWLNAAGRSATAFDFPTKGILQEALKKGELWRLRDRDGKPPGLVGWWPNRAVTFTANHDTDSTQKHWPFPSDQVGAGYAYLMTHPGMPCVFCDHYFKWGSELTSQLKTLAAVRRRNGIQSDSPVKILAAESDLYVAEVAGRVTVKLGPRMEMGSCLPKESDGWKTAVWGHNFCVWERAARD